MTSRCVGIVAWLGSSTGQSLRSRQVDLYFVKQTNDIKWLRSMLMEAFNTIDGRQTVDTGWTPDDGISATLDAFTSRMKYFYSYLSMMSASNANRCIHLESGVWKHWKIVNFAASAGGLSYSSVRHWWNGCVHANIPNGCVQSGYNTRINLLDRDVMTYIVGTACVQCPLPTAASFTDRVIRHPLSSSVSIYMRPTSSITAKLIIECR